MLHDGSVEIGSSMVEITENDLYGGDVAELTKAMNELVTEVEIEAENFDEENLEYRATESVVSVNEVCCPKIDGLSKMYFYFQKKRKKKRKGKKPQCSEDQLCALSPGYCEVRQQFAGPCQERILARSSAV